MTSPSPNIEFYSAPDGRRLAVRVWQAAGTPQGRVAFLHGITSHGGWYSRSCQYLAERGFEVHFVDRRGSGLNAESPGDIDGWTTWIDDVTTYLEQLRAEQPAALCGISWGGKLAAAIARRQPGLVKALALICPGIYSPHEPNAIKRTALAMPLPAKWGNRRVGIPLRRAALFTDSPAWQQFIAEDPLSLRQVTWRFAGEDRRLTRYAREAAPFLHMPVLVTLAGRDRIVDNRRTRAYLARTGTTCRTLIEYSAAAHTLEFEPNPQPFFSDLANWLATTMNR